MPPTPWLGVNTEGNGRQACRVARSAGRPGREGRRQARRCHRGIDGQPSLGLNDFCRQVRARGSAGVTVPLDIERGSEERRIDIKSMNRRDHLKLNSTF